MKKIKLMTLFYFTFGILGFLSTYVLWYHGEDLKKYLGALVISVLLILLGVLNRD